MAAVLTTDLDSAAKSLRAGGLVAFATETVYGLGANALDVQAVARVFEAKQRPYFDPLIVHLADSNDIDTVAVDVPDMARRLISRFWPGPLTLVLPKREIVPDLVTAGLAGVAVRVPDHHQARELIRRSGVPVAAPSANPFGRISPTTAQHVLQHLGNQIDMVVEGGACRIGIESTVLQLVAREQPVLLRPGGLPLEAIEAVIGPITLPVGEGEKGGAQVAPGRLLKHYAPRKKLVILTGNQTAPSLSSTGLLSLNPVMSPQQYGRVEVLSQTGDLCEAAAHFFAALRRLDDAPEIETIYASPFPDEGLGLALNDRLSRAAR